MAVASFHAVAGVATPRPIPSALCPQPLTKHISLKGFSEFLSTVSPGPPPFHISVKRLKALPGAAGNSGTSVGVTAVSGIAESLASLKVGNGSWSRSSIRRRDMGLDQCLNSRTRPLRTVRAAANAERIETPAPEAPTPPASPAATESEEGKRDRRAADWKRAEKLKEAGTVHKGRVDSCNSGGLLVRVNSLQGFLPFSHLNGARTPKDGSKLVSEVGNELVGGYVSVKVIECVEAERRLIVSEKQAVLVDILQQIREGDIYQGKVNFVTDYGAFVDLQFPDGSYPVSGLVHVTELSWDPVPFPQDFITQGQDVKVKVIQVDREKSKLALSIKQLLADPLLETLDTLMPSQEDGPTGDAELIGTSLPGLEQICDYILQEEGISGVTLGRQALERRVVSQDLELWLSNASAEDGKFTLLARAGRQVQEVYLDTSLDRDGIKAAVQRVTGRVP